MAAVAAANHSVITMADVKAADGTRKNADARLNAGRWIEEYECVFRLAGAPWTYEGRVLAALKAAGDDARASHLCAARLLGIGFRTALPEISIPRTRNFRSKSMRVHTSTDLDRCGTVLRDGIAITDPARTLLDTARYVRPVAFRKAVEDARRLDLVDWRALSVCLATHARQGRHGITQLREAIANGARNDGITDTDSELVALAVIRQNGLPEPTLQHQVRAADGRLVAEMDFAYLPSKTDIEIDGDAHLDPVQRAKDDARDHELRVKFGWTVRRVWWEIPVYKPREFVRIVRETLGLRPESKFL